MNYEDDNGTGPSQAFMGATGAISLPRELIGLGKIRLSDGALIDPLGGVIDEVVVYDRALGAGEIESHFNAIPEPASLILLLTGALGLLLAISLLASRGESDILGPSNSILSER